MSDHPTAPTDYSGEDYRPEREQAQGDRRPSGHPLIGDPDTVEPPLPDAEGRDIPPENGKRGWIDPDTGEVHGSGSGAGGGNPGEGFDADTPGHY